MTGAEEGPASLSHFRSCRRVINHLSRDSSHLVFFDDDDGGSSNFSRVESSCFFDDDDDGGSCARRLN